MSGNPPRFPPVSNKFTPGDFGAPELFGDRMETPLFVTKNIPPPKALSPLPQPHFDFDDVKEDFEAQSPQPPPSSRKQPHDDDYGNEATYSSPAQTYPIGPDGKRDFSLSPAQRAHPDVTFDADMTICYRDMTVKLKVPDEERVVNVLSPVTDLFRAIGTCGASCTRNDCGALCARNDFYRIKDVSGVIRPGTMTLVLSGPGDGKSSYLRALANRIRLSGGRAVYNGRTFREAEKEEIDLVKASNYCDQVDVHFPLLTVYETIQFAHQMTSINYSEERIEETIALLGLEECRNTVVGDAMIRGVSGSQKKLLTIGESLVSDAKILFMDEFSNGLDASTAYEIGMGLSKFCRRQNSSIVATLQQPTPELLALFDRIVVLREGQVVFDGPVCDVAPFFVAMGFTQPQDVDPADWLVDCISQPRSVVLKQQERELRHQRRIDKRAGGSQAPRSKPLTVQSSYGPLQVSASPCITTEEMVEYYRTTPQWKEIEETLDRDLPKAEINDRGKEVYPKLDHSQYPTLKPTEKTQEIFCRGYRLPVLRMLGYVISRQFKAVGRNTFTIFSRLIACIVMCLVYGSLYWNVQPDEQILRLASILIGVAQLAFCNFVEIPNACKQLPIVRKQLSAKFYPAWMYTFATWLSAFPMNVLEATLVNVILYFLTNAYPGAKQWFSNWGVLICVSVALSAWFRCLSVLAGDEQSANSLAPPLTGVMIVFGGLFVTYSNLHDSISWLYWLSPFSWAVRSSVNIEFLSPRYDHVVISASTGYPTRIGHVYLDIIDMKAGTNWIGWGCLYLLGFSIFATLINAMFVWKRYYEESRGTTRITEPELIEYATATEAIHAEDQLSQDIDDELLKQQIQVAAAQQAKFRLASPTSPRVYQMKSDVVSSYGASSRTSGGSALRSLDQHVPFVPAWLSFSNISYTVQVKHKGQTTDHILLHNINGYAQPGKLTSLMGASGAGKTTLLDVIAGLKNTGVVEGSTLINGQPATKSLLAATSGYVEQFHTLYPYETVYETLLFAARLRLPKAISDTTKKLLVSEIIDILELSNFRGNIIGNDTLRGLSPAQAKRVNIGVELINSANPSILFLDEPTAGLDARSAATVMKVLRRLAASGRSVICTLHQPTASLFFLFDRLLLLGTGGYQIYFGDLGYRGQTFIKYLSRCPGITPIKPRMNPASWMLTELGVAATVADGPIVVEPDEGWDELEPSTRTAQKFAKMYKMSEWYSRTMKRLEMLQSIEIIDPGDVKGVERYKEEVEMIEMKTTQAKNAQKKHRKGGHNDNGEGDELIADTTIPSTTVTILPKKRPNCCEQYSLLYARNFSAYWRNRGLMYYRLGVQILLSALFGWIYWNLTPSNLSSALSLIGAIFVTVLFSTMISTSSAASVFAEGKPVFLRETAAKFYYPFLWAVCQFTIEMVWTIPSLIVTVVISYFMINLKQDVGTFFLYTFWTYMFFLTFVCWAMMASSLTLSSFGAFILMGAIMGLTNGLSGIAITRAKIPAGWKWLHLILPAPRVLEALLIPQLKDNDIPMAVINPDGSTFIVTVAEWAESYLGFSFDTKIWTMMYWVVVFFVVTHAISYLGVTFLSFQQEKNNNINQTIKKQTPTTNPITHHPHQLGLPSLH